MARRRRYRLKPAGYAVLFCLILLIGLTVFLIARAVSGNNSQKIPEATPTPIIANFATPTPTLPPIGTQVPIQTNSPEPLATLTPTPAAPTQSPTPGPTATPDSSIRKPTSEEKSNAKKGYLSGDGINLRVGPSTDFMSLGKYEKNDTLIVYDSDEAFYFVKMDKDDAIGFMSKDYITLGVQAVVPENVPDDVIAGTVTARTVLAIRNGPSKENKAIAEMKSGAPVYIYYQTGDFYYVEDPATGKKGFSSAEYISPSGTVPKGE